MNRRFAFDARATMAAIEARRVRSAGAVPAVLAAPKPPQEPQQPQPQGTDLSSTRPRATSDSEHFDTDAIEERAGLAADSVPACYLDAWARLNHQKPASV